jgi:hypothetical protein
MWAGVDIQTALNPDRIRLAVMEVVAGSKGRIELTADTPLLLGLDINRLRGTVKFSLRGNTRSWMTFDVQISDEAGGRRAVRTHILRALLSDSSIPFGPKKMDAYDAYIDFVRTFGTTVSASDPTARVSVRQGSMPPDFPLASLDRRVSPPSLAG